LSLAQNWCEKVDLSVNPNKRTAILFTKNWNLNGFSKSKLFGSELKLQNKNAPRSNFRLKTKMEQLHRPQIGESDHCFMAKPVEIVEIVGRSDILTRRTEANPLLLTPNDMIELTHVFGRKLSVGFRSGTDWLDPGSVFAPYSVIFYTDGSLLNGRAVAGVYSKSQNTGELWQTRNSLHCGIDGNEKADELELELKLEKDENVGGKYTFTFIGSRRLDASSPNNRLLSLNGL
jgi:hypothetical protein